MTFFSQTLMFAKWRLSLKVLPFVFLLLGLKSVAHYFHLEFINLNSLFTSLISANVFLVGFLINGVLADYKESEKIPSEISSSLETLTDEGLILKISGHHAIASAYLLHIKSLTDAIILWFHKQERTVDIKDKLSDFNQHFQAFEAVTQANFIVRLKQEQNNIRKLIKRIDSIRSTSFNTAAYAIAEITTLFSCIGLIFLIADPFYESFFTVAIVSFTLIYMVLLIKDLDNPFSYYDKKSYTDEISLIPIYDFLEKIKSVL